MYHFFKALFYPPKTLICLVGELLFCRQLRKTLGPAVPRKTEVALRPMHGDES
jgi:hypothetical protein